jgi:hypothetical protein
MFHWEGMLVRSRALGGDSDYERRRIGRDGRDLATAGFVPI